MIYKVNCKLNPVLYQYTDIIRVQHRETISTPDANNVTPRKRVAATVSKLINQSMTCGTVRTGIIRNLRT